MITLALLITLTPVQKTAAKELAARTVKTNAKGIEMVYVPAGVFTMGSHSGVADELPVRKVHLDAYRIGKNVVTVAQFRKFTQEAHFAHDWVALAPRWGWQDDNPMVYVTWEDSRAFCKWAGGDLPTEAQWEKAARGTRGRIFPWGNALDASKLRFNRSSEGDAGSTIPVGSYPSGASPYGCLDMAGNVWQWCLDWYGPYKLKDSRNPRGPVSGEGRVLRGGSWSNINPDYFRCASRYWSDPSSVGYDCGFRVAARP